MKNEAGGHKKMLALHVICCGGLLLFVFGGLSLGALAAWLAEGGYKWGVAGVGLLVALGVVAFVRRRKNCSTAQPRPNSTVSAKPESADFHRSSDIAQRLK
jgi:uncharacterized membrane protein YqjE